MTASFSPQGPRQRCAAGPAGGAEESCTGRGDEVPAAELPTPPLQPADDGSDPRREVPPGADPREYCMSDRDIVEVVRTEYVYTRPPPWSDTLPTIHVVTPTYSRPVRGRETQR